MARSKFPHPISYSVGPFEGLREAPSPSGSSPSLASVLTNVVPDAGLEGYLEGRPGLLRVSSTQMGSGTPRNGQCVIQHTSLAGTRYTFFVCDGQLWRLSWPALPATLTNVTPVGVTIDASATHVFAVTYNDAIIVSDGVNRPWEMTNLSSTPVTGTYLTGVSGAAFGPPFVYYGVLGFIKANERSTFIWSEVNSAHTGYEDIGDFNYAWTLGQTDQNQLVCMLGTNSHLYYFRERSTGAISGPLDANVVNDGVHDGVSTTTGTKSPAAVTLIDDTIFFLDQNGFPHKVSVGGGSPVPIWKDIAESLAGVGVEAFGGDLDEATASYCPDLDMWVVAHPKYGVQPISVLVHHVPSERWYGTWTANGLAFNWVKLGLAIDADDQEVLIVLDEEGWAYKLTLQQSNDPHDRLDGSTATAVPHEVRTGWVGYSDKVQQQFDRVDFAVRSTDAGGTYTYALSHATSRGSGFGSAQNVTVEMPSFGTGAIGDRHGACGINALGRGLQLKLTHSSTTTAFTLHQLTVSGNAISDAPGQY